MEHEEELRLNDDERLTEIGRILSTGVMRIIKRKHYRAAKTRLAAGEKTGLIVRDGEHFADGGCPEESLTQTSPH